MREGVLNAKKQSSEVKAKDSIGFTHHAARFALAHRRALISLLAVSLFYLAALIAMPPDALTHHDTGAKYLQVRNLRLAPNGLDWSIKYPARRLDPDLEFVPFNPKQHVVEDGGRIFLQWPIFLGLLTRIPWKVMGFWGLYLVPLLAGLGTAWIAYRLASNIGVPGRLAWLAVPLVGLATPMFVYSLLYFEHTLAALLVTASLLVSVRGLLADTPNRRLIALSAAILALAIYFRSELYILALVMLGAHMIQAVRDKVWRVPLIWLGAFAVALIPLWAFYAIKEGTILPLHATWYFAGSSGGEGASSGGLELPRLRYLASAGLRVVPDFLFGPQTFPLSPRYPFGVEVIGLIGVALCALAALGRLLRLKIAWRLGILAFGLTLTLAAPLVTLLSPDPYYNLHGFLTASPFVLMALWPTGDSIQGSRLKVQSWLFAVTLVYVALHVLVISALSGLGPMSRHEWGQRYLLPAYPALVVLALLGAWRLWSEHGTNVRRLVMPALALGAIMVLVGIGLEARGWAMLRAEREQVGTWLNMARSMPAGEPLVTDVWWLPLNLAADFYTRPMMLAEGSNRLNQWALAMRERGVRSFGLMTESQELFQSDWQRGAGYRAEGPPEWGANMWLQRYTLP